MLPGMLPSLGLLAGAAVTFVDSAQSSNSAQITIPVTANQNDLAVLIDFGIGSFVAPTEVVPSGWTKLAGASVASSPAFCRVVASYKKLGDSDPGASITGMAVSAANNKIMLVFRSPFITFTPSTWNAECTSGNPASQSVSASGQTPPLIVFAMAAAEFAATSVGFSTESPVFDAKISNTDTDLVFGYKIYAGAPSNHTVDMNDLDDNNCLVSGYIRLS